MGDPAGTIVVTTNFDQVVRTLSGMQGYSSNRGSGTVAAKTIEDHVIINASVLNEPGHGGLERLTAHESGHVVMNLRDEHGRHYHHLARTQWQWEVTSLGIKGIEEYRIERKLTELGYSPASAVSTDHWDEVLYQMNATLVESVLVQQSVSDMATQVIGGADTLVAAMAYSIGALQNETAPFKGEKGLPPYGLQNWEDLVAPTWAQRIRLYESCPVCTEPIVPSDWETKIKEAQMLEHELLRSFGFALSGEGEDESFTRTGSDELFQTRLIRLQHQDYEG